MNGLTLGESPTSRECAWNQYGANKKILPKEVAKMKWKKPHYHKKGTVMEIIKAHIHTV